MNSSITVVMSMLSLVSAEKSNRLLLIDYSEILNWNFESVWENLVPVFQVSRTFEAVGVIT